MHLESGCKEASDCGKTCTQNDTHKQSENNSYTDGKTRKIKYMAENHTRIDALVHNDGCSRHTHTNHTANGKVRTGKENESREACCRIFKILL